MKPLSFYSTILTSIPETKVVRLSFLYHAMKNNVRFNVINEVFSYLKFGDPDSKIFRLQNGIE
jgi:hypothetical protein